MNDLSNPAQANWPAVVNENFDALPNVVYAYDYQTSTGLTWGYFGGRWGGNAVADGTLSLTNAATNYVVANRSTGAVSVSTSNTNWNDTTNYARVYKLTTAGSAVTATEDHRAGLYGVHGIAVAPGAVGTVTSVNITPPAAGITASGGPITSAGAITLALANDLAALEALGGTGIPERTGTDSWAQRTLDSDATLAANSATRIPSQSAVKAYVDASLQGLAWKQAVRAATTANGTLATAFENGDTIDGVTLATGDRILIKNQSSGAENGIYVVAASGAPARASDADTGAELVNATVLVSEGTTNADTQWTCTTNATITVGSTSLAFAQVSGGGSGITALTGDVTASGTGSVAATIANDAVSNAKLANMATQTIKGRTAGSTGDPEDLTAAQVAAILGTNVKSLEHIAIACSDETTALTTGTEKVTFRMPYAFTLTDVRASVTTAPTGGTLLTVDVNESGSSILSTKLTFDASEKTTTTAATPRVISDSSLADDAEITIDIDAVGSTIAGAGLKVYLIGYRT